MTLLNTPTCDLCHGIDVHNVCKHFYEEDTQVHYSVCPDCLEVSTAKLLPMPTDADVEWS
jgi:hypothetical protein